MESVQESGLPLVSVVVPVYGPDPAFWREALLSLAEQKDVDLEVIFTVDGGVPWPGWEEELFADAAMFRPRVVYNVGTPGIFSNINNGLRHAEGEFVQLFCQDDVMYSGFLRRQSEILRDRPEVGLVFSAFDAIDASGVNVNHYVRFTFRPDQDRLIMKQDASALFILYGCLPGNLSPVMFRRAALSDVGLFDTGMPYAGDFDFWVRLSRSWDLYYLSAPGLQVRRHDRQASMMLPNRQLLLDLVRVYRRLLESVTEDKIDSHISHINRTVGAAFIHHAVVSACKRDEPLRMLRERWLDLRQYPFNPVLASLYYLFSIPSRLFRKIGA